MSKVDMSNFIRYNLYEDDVTIVKQYGDYILKVCNMSQVRISGLEKQSKDSELFVESKYSKKNSVNAEKLSNNISRAKSKVLELALCNDWDYFVTFTIDKEKYNRYDLKTYRKDFSEFLHNFNRRRSKEDKVSYILIPELHEDGAWHMHGLIHGLQPTDLFINQNGYPSWKSYNDKFGFMEIDKVKSKERVSSYITKYITKEVDKSVKELGGHLYYSSNGLKTAEQLYRGKAKLLCDWDYEHPDGYCRIKTFDIRKDNYTDYLVLE